MYSLTQSSQIRGSAGEVVSSPFRSLPVNFVRGNLILIAAGPGVGKSAFVLNLLLGSGASGLYVSADSDAPTQHARAVAIKQGILLESAMDHVLNGDVNPRIDQEIAESPIRMLFRASPTLDEIESVMQTFEEVFGAYPEIVVIDNITNLDLESGQDDPFSGLESLMDYLNVMARETEACVIGLHHVTGAYNDGSIPIPMSGIKGQIARVPQTVLTLHRVTYANDLDELRVSVVKQRGGKADASGMTSSSLTFDGSRMRIYDTPR